MYSLITSSVTLLLAKLKIDRKVGVLINTRSNSHLKMGVLNHLMEYKEDLSLGKLFPKAK